MLPKGVKFDNAFGRGNKNMLINNFEHFHKPIIFWIAINSLKFLLFFNKNLWYQQIN